ncbi:hypothetical protein HMPREF0045_01268 [Actinomyces graevenitzii C83]|uniref:Uncharacterized protein n=1 Tax=Actinomyces graevenitzii C83 TaxID=435830 RepID=G9PG12_9ACTO|nr:hypothetical protein HMPREF0045_01268 [Actinomyces graevenitzii C83]
MGVMLDFMFGRDHRSSRSLQVTFGNLLRGVGLSWFRGDDGGVLGLGQGRGLRQACGLGEASVVVRAQKPKTLAALFAGLLACLLLASGANAATVETAAVSAKSNMSAVAGVQGSVPGAQSSLKASNAVGEQGGAMAALQNMATGVTDTHNCGATATTRIRPLILVVTDGLTWPVVRDTPSPRGDAVSYLLTYPGIPMNLVATGRNSKTLDSNLTSTLFSGKNIYGQNGHYGYSELMASPLVKSLKAAGCSVSVDPSFSKRYYYSEGFISEPLGSYTSDVTIAYFDGDQSGSSSSYAKTLFTDIAKIRNYYNNSVDVMVVSLSCAVDLRSVYGGEFKDKQPCLALMPESKDVDSTNGYVRVPSTRTNNLIKLTDIAPTIAARYGAKSLPGATGVALPLTPERVDKALLAKNYVELKDDSGTENNVETIPSYRVDHGNLISFLIAQNQHMIASGKVGVYNTLLMFIFSLLIVRIWYRGFECDLKFFHRVNPHDYSQYFTRFRQLCLFAGCLPIGYLAANSLPWYLSYAYGDENFYGRNDYLDYDDLTKLQILTSAALAIIVGLLLVCLIEQVCRKFLNYASSFIFVAGLNALLWLGDAFSGGYLTRNTPLGVDIVASGRFYGVNYVSFSFGVLGTIIVVVICADWLKEQYDLRVSLLVLGAVGAILVACMASPAMGDNLTDSIILAVTLLVPLLELCKHNLKLNALVASGFALANLVLLALSGALTDEKLNSLKSPFVLNAKHGIWLSLAVLLAIVVVVRLWFKFSPNTQGADVPARYGLLMDTLTVLVLMELALDDQGLLTVFTSLSLLIAFACMLYFESVMPVGVKAKSADSADLEGSQNKALQATFAK